MKINNQVYTISLKAPESVLSQSILEFLIEELSKHQQNYDKIQTTNTKEFINQKGSNLLE